MRARDVALQRTHSMGFSICWFVCVGDALLLSRTGEAGFQEIAVVFMIL